VHEGEGEDEGLTVRFNTGENKKKESGKEKKKQI